MQQTLLAPRAVKLMRDPLYTYTRKLEFLILILTVDDFASRSLGRRSLRSCANRLRAWSENRNRCWTKRGGPECTTVRDEAGARGTQELPGRADTTRHQPPGEPQGVVGGDNLHDGTGQPDAVDQLAAIRGLRQQAERSLKEGHHLWLQGVRGERGANGQQERNTAQENVRLAAGRERAALKPAEQAEQQARLARP